MLFYLISAYFIKNMIFKIFLSFGVFLILFIFSYNHHLIDEPKYEIASDYEYKQKKIINYLNNNNDSKKLLFH